MVHDKNDLSVKMAVNVSMMELAQMDLLVDNLYYTNRSEFVRMAVRAALERHRPDLEALLNQQIASGNSLDRHIIMGYAILSKKDLETSSGNGEKLWIRAVGVLRIADDITPELIEARVQSCKVYGRLYASDEVKEALEKLEQV